MQTIEIIGIPGSGKSTDFGHLLDDLRCDNLKVFTEKQVLNKYFQRKYKILKFLSIDSLILTKLSRKIYKLSNLKNKILLDFILDHQSFIQKIFEINNIRNISQDEKKYVVKLLFETIVIYEMAKNILEENEYLMIDEGFLHKMMTIFVSKDIDINDKDLNELLFFYNKPYKVIGYEIDMKVSMNRLRNRERGMPKRMSKLQEADQIKYLENMQVMYKKIIDICYKNKIPMRQKNTYHQN